MGDRSRELLLRAVTSGLPARLEPIHRRFAEVATGPREATILLCDVITLIPETVGVIAGGGSQKAEMELLAQEMGLRPVVTFLGRVPDMTAVYPDADLLVLTSDHEGAPNVVMEAMACGIPVVATDAGDAHAIIGEGQGGFCARSEDELATQVASLVTDPGLRDAMGRAARETALRSFSIGSLGNALQDIYRRIER